MDYDEWLGSISLSHPKDKTARRTAKNRLNIILSYGKARFQLTTLPGALSKIKSLPDKKVIPLAIFGSCNIKAGENILAFEYQETHDHLSKAITFDPSSIQTVSSEFKAYM